MHNHQDVLNSATAPVRVPAVTRDILIPRPAQRPGRTFKVAKPSSTISKRADAREFNVASGAWERPGVVFQ